MSTNENELNQQDGSFELDIDLLEDISGGRIMNDKTKATLNNYIRECKLRGLSISDALTELQNIYGSNMRYCNEFIGYVTENW